MKRSLAATLVFLVASLGLTGGCAPLPEENRGAATGAIIGAATGAVIGAEVAGEGSRTQGAIIGGLVGALLGSAIGSYDDNRRNGDEPFDAGQDGTAEVKVKLREVSVTPAKADPGDRVDLGATYTIKAQYGHPRVAVTEIREIRYKGDLVGNPEISLTRTPGTYDSNVPLFLSRTAKPGTYRVTTIIKTPSGSASKESSFTVR